MKFFDNVALNIDILVKEKDMYCPSCTGTVTYSIIQFLSGRKLSNEAQCTVSAHHHYEENSPDTIQIKNLVFPDKAKMLAEFMEALLVEISDIGFRWERYNIICNRHLLNMSDLERSVKNIDLESQIPKITDYYIEKQANTAITITGSTQKKQQNRFSDIVSGSTSLGLGIILMTLEHMNKMESRTLELTLGCISTVITLFTGKHHFQNAIRRQGAMDTLISLGCGGAILYSFLLIFQPPFLKNDTTTSSFFDVPLMILGFLKLSHVLRSMIEKKIRQQENVVETIENSLPQKVSLQSGEMKDINEIAPQTHIMILNGEIIPIDGKLTSLHPEESIIVNEKFFTGNDRQKVKKNGDMLYAGTMNTTGKILFLETSCHVNDNQIYKTSLAIRKQAETENIIEWVIKYFLRGVLSMATISALCWGLFGPEPSTSNAIQVFLAMILSACPCGLGLLELNTVLSKLLALEEGILIQKKAAFDMNKVTDICIDKCGTLTCGEYELKSIQSFFPESISAEELLNYAVALQRVIPKEDQAAMSEAILKKQPACEYQATEYKANPANKGRGGQAIVNEKTITIGNKALLNAFSIPTESIPSSSTFVEKSNGVERFFIYIAIEKEVVGFLMLQPLAEKTQTFRSDFVSCINYLIQEEKTVHILTGDDSLENARVVAEKLISEINLQIFIVFEKKIQWTIGNEHDPIVYIVGGMHPKDKIDYIKALQDNQKIVAMLGDGANDEGAIQTANVGLVIHNDAVARNVSDAILNGNFSALIQLISLSKSYHQAYNTSVVIAFGTNTGLLLTSAGVFYPLTKEIVNPMFVGMGMGGSSLLLMINIAIWQNIARQRKQGIFLSLTQKESPLTSSNKSLLFSKTIKKDALLSHQKDLLPERQSLSSLSIDSSSKN